MPEVSVLIATHDHGSLLARAVGSALRQTVQELEVLIVGDGADERTRDVANGLTEDPRVRFFDFPKAAETGGALRHLTLQEARGDVVCYLDDDDLWMPRHVEIICNLLEDADFAHTLPVAVEPIDRLIYGEVDLSVAGYRELLLKGLVSVPKTFVGHTIGAYRQLEGGWRARRRSVVVQDMWQQLLSVDGCRVASATVPTALQFMDFLRPGWSMDQRLRELDRWSCEMSGPEWPLRILDVAARSTLSYRLHVMEVGEWLREGERYAHSLRSTLEATRASLREAEVYAASLESTLLARTAAFAEVERYARSLEADRSEREGAQVESLDPRVERNGSNA